MAILHQFLIAADDLFTPADPAALTSAYLATDDRFERTGRAQPLFRVDLTDYTIAGGNHLQVTVSYNIKVDNPGAQATYTAAGTGSTTGAPGSHAETLTAATDAEYRVDLVLSLAGVTATENIYLQDKISLTTARVKRGLAMVTFEVVAD